MKKGFSLGDVRTFGCAQTNNFYQPNLPLPLGEVSEQSEDGEGSMSLPKENVKLEIARPLSHPQGGVAEGLRLRTLKAPLCKGSCRASARLRDCRLELMAFCGFLPCWSLIKQITSTVNPSGSASPHHLPLHKGGGGFCELSVCTPPKIGSAGAPSAIFCGEDFQDYLIRRSVFHSAAISYAEAYFINPVRAFISLKKSTLSRAFFLVEMAVIETASENPSAQLSTSVAGLLAIPLRERQAAGSPVR